MHTSDPALALLDLVEADRADRCTQIAQANDAATRELLGDARRTARARVHAALETERWRLGNRLAALDAALATETRLHAQRRLRALLDEAWRRLPGALDARWRDAAGRREWTQQVLDSACADLGRGEWSIAHAPGWPEPERQRAIEELAAKGFAVNAAAEDPRIRAGLQVRSGGNLLDGTLHGLLADRNAVSARFLDALTRSGP